MATWTVEYLDSGEWVAIRSFACPAEAMEYGECQERDYSYEVEFRVVRS